ncbi:MAG: carboxypeptidase regulatory-like domain-containing protein [Pirellulaceae bacterium]|nr:carboxypeptidase regulatory-like domain-containing protein [Pirellulaceae bacterium]
MRQVILLGGLLAAMVGCGGDGLDRVPIQGVLTANGTPVPSAIVQFTPKGGTPGEGAIGQSDAEGKFTVISSRQDDSGVPPGKYSVRISLLTDGKGNPLPPDATQADHPDAKESIPAPYSTPNSPLEVTIDDKGGAVLIDMPAKIAGLKKK